MYSKCRNECHACGSSLKWIIMMKHPEESSHWKTWYSLKWSPPPPAPRSPAARHNPHSGTDRLTNKVNKYFPPLLKANQILILEVWSAGKKKKANKQLVEGNWSNWFSRNARGRAEEDEEEEEVGRVGQCWLGTVGIHFRLRMDKYLDISA